MKLLTIVVPCYNVEQYLAECLDSILDSKYNDVLEVLAINDGSKDGTLALAREYEARFPEILRVIDKPNGGWGTVINMAIAEARGRYFKILDSDDWFDKAAFAEFVVTLRNSKSDLLTNVYTEVYVDKTIPGHVNRIEFCDKIWKMEEYAEKTGRILNLPMTNIAIKTQILRNNSFKAPDRYYGDIYYLLCVTAWAKTISVTNINLYQYRKNLIGQSTSVESYKRNYKDYIVLTKSLISFYNEVVTTNNIKKVLKKDIIGAISFSYKLLMSREYCVNFSESHGILLDFNKYLKHTSPELYRACFKITNKHVPYVLIWRLFNINLFKLR